MNRPTRILLLTVFLTCAWAEPAASWRGKTAEGRALTISVTDGSVTSVALNVAVSCVTAVDEGMKVFSGSAVAISGSSMRFNGQAESLCGAIQLRLDGTIDGNSASGNVTVTPPKLADNPAKKKVAWKADREAVTR